MITRCLLLPPPARLPDTLVVSGGGVKGIAGLGALAHLRRAGVLSNVRNVVATSSGSIVGALLVMDRMETGLHHILRHTYTPDVDLGLLQNSFGLDSGKTIAELLDKIVDPPDLTLEGLRRATGKSLCVCTTNVSRRRVEVLTPSTHPDLTLRDAIRASCAVPLVFAAHQIGGEWHADGGVAANVPLPQARELFPDACILAICYEAEAPRRRRGGGCLLTLGDYVGSLFETFAGAAPDRHANAAVLRLAVPCKALDFKLHSRARYRLFLKGATQARAWLKKHQ